MEEVIVVVEKCAADYHATSIKTFAHQSVKTPVRAQSLKDSPQFMII
jgi:hypothetical protein